MVNKWVSRYSKRMGLWKRGSLWLKRWRGVWVFGPGLLKWLVAIFVGDPSLRYWHILTPIPTPDLMTWVTCGVCDPRAAPPGVEAMRRTADLMAWTAATKSAGPWEKALAMSMAMAPGVETWTWRRWKTLKDVGKAAKPWKRLEKIEKSTATGARVSADMEKGAVLRIELLVHHLIFALAQCPCKVFVKRSFRCPMVVPWLSHGCTGLLVFRNQMQRIRWFCLVPWETGKFSLPSCRWAEGCFVIKVSGWRHANFHNGTVRQE